MPPEMSRMAIHGTWLASSMPKLWMGVMFGCSSRAMTLASRWKRSAEASSCTDCAGSTFSAT